MATVYPGAPPGSATDNFTVPSQPEGVPLSSAGDALRDHPQLHEAEGDAIEALQAWAALRTHDHSGDPANVAKGSKLLQANTHQSPDTDSPGGIHHTLGLGHEQAARGDHAHAAYVPGYQTCTSLTRPTSPFLGMTIFETDTNATRCYFKLTPARSGPIWQLVPVTLIPVVRVEARTTQVVAPNVDHLCAWTDILWRIGFCRSSRWPPTPPRSPSRSRASTT